MASVSATSYATPSLQAMLGRAKLDEARREADQAENNAKVLRQEANQAEQDAQNGQTRVTTVSQQVAQTDSTYANQLRQQTAANSSQQLQTKLQPLSTAAANQYSRPENPLQPSTKLWTASQNTTVNGQLVDQTA